MKDKEDALSIVMNMSNYVVEEISATETVHREEAMSAEMNSPLLLAIQQHDATLVPRHAILPASLASVDVDTFLQKMSACRH